MLKTNSKKAKENIKKYILDHFNPCDSRFLDLEGTTDIKTACSAIYTIFNIEKAAVGTYARMSEKERFVDWCKGLPSILDTCYYYNRSAVDDLGEILEETESEKEKYSDDEAAVLLTNLLYREIVKNM